MQLITVLNVISLLFAVPAFSTLTAADIEKIRSIIKAWDKRLTGEIETLGERLNHIFMLVMALVAFIAVVIGIPQIIVAMQRKDILFLGAVGLGSPIYRAAKKCKTRR